MAFGGTGVSSGTGIKRTQGRIHTSKRRHNATAPGTPFFLNRQVVRFAAPRPQAQIYNSGRAFIRGDEGLSPTSRTTVARLHACSSMAPCICPSLTGTGGVAGLDPVGRRLDARSERKFALSLRRRTVVPAKRLRPRTSSFRRQRCRPPATYTTPCRPQRRRR